VQRLEPVETVGRIRTHILGRLPHGPRHWPRAL
jgi:hypothetical protein